VPLVTARAAALPDVSRARYVSGLRMASEASQPDSDGTGAAEEPSAGVAGLLRSLGAALRFLVGLPARGPDALVETARGMLFFPLIGLGLGVAVAAAATLAVAWMPAVLAAPAIVALLLALGGGTTARAVADGVAAQAGRGAVAVAAGGAALAGLLAAKAVAIVLLRPDALGLAIALSVMLGRWAMVVEAYGSIPVEGDPLAEAMTRHAKFREFGNASVSAMALTLVLANAVGLVLLFAAATGAIAVRVAAHRLRGGVTRTSLLAVVEIVESGTLLLAALVARAVAS
jgi:adenosylcobinamide-GDP ribazoletransferase